MSNVLILFSSSQLGGAEKSLSRMAFLSKNLNYYLGTLDVDGPWCDWVRGNSCSPLVYGNYNFLSLINKLYQDIKQLPIDVVYVCGLRASFLIRLLLLFNPKVKLIHGVRWNPNSNSLLDRSFRVVETLFSWMVDGWIVNSKVTKDTLVSRCNISNNNVYVIYNGVNLPSDIKPYSERPMEILTVANLNKRKGYINYLENISKIVSLTSNIKLKFIFIGRDDMNGAVQKKIVDLDLSEYVSYEGFQSNVDRYYNRAKLFVLPSLWGEGCPTVILEALSYSIPVLAYNIDGIPELINNNSDGLLMDIEGDREFNEIVNLLNNNDSLSAMGKLGRTKIECKFTIESCTNNHNATINKILEE